MKRVGKIVLVGLVVLLFLGAAISYSWTFTPLGRLDYPAAVLARILSWQDPQEFTPEDREFINQLGARTSFLDPISLPRIEDREVGSGDLRVPVRIYWPRTDEVLPFYLDIHGGGWRVGNGFVFHDRTTHFATYSDAIVVSVDYRLAPEDPYPAALDDVSTVLDWIHEHGASLGGDPERIAIGGSSAGGNLAAALALRARDEGGPKILFQYLRIPATDLSGTRSWASFAETGDNYALKVSDIGSMIEDYVPDPTVRNDPYVSPLLAASLAGLPPALVVTNLFDPLRDQGEAYAEALQDAGVPTRLHREPGSLHGFAGSPARADKVLKMAAQSVHEALHP